MPRRPGLAAAPAQWKTIGPNSQSSLYWGKVSGRVTTLAVDDQGPRHTLYVGTAFGGLWKTDDYTATSPHFTPIGDLDWPSLAVGSIAIQSNSDPLQSRTIYVGTGEANGGIDSYYGVGILRSTDSGQSWSISTGSKPFVPISSQSVADLDGPFVGAAVSKIVLDPHDPKHILITVSSSQLGSTRSPKTAIYESANAGDSWQPMQVAGTSEYNPTDLIYEPVEHSFYAAVEGRGIFRLAAGSASWKSTSSSFGVTATSDRNFARASLATRSEDGKAIVYAVISAGWFAENDRRNYDLSRPNDTATGLVRSDDRGASWRAIPSPPGLFGNNEGDKQGFYDQWIAAPNHASTLLIGGIDIWKAPSSGSPVWTNLTNGYYYDVRPLADPSHAIHPDQHAIVVLDDMHWIVGSDGGVWMTADGGSTWKDLNTDIDSLQLMSVSEIGSHDRDYIIGSQDNGTMLANGGGAQWSTTLTGDGGYTLSSLMSGRSFTERFNISLCRSDDFGQHWNTVVDGEVIRDASAFYVPYALVHGNDKLVLGTKRIWLGDAAPAASGVGWHTISGQLSPRGVVQSVAAAPSAPGTIYVVTSDSLVYTNPNVFAPNVSANWSSIKKSNLPNNRPYSAIAIDPQNWKIAYLGVQGFGTGHVFRTDNGGRSWQDVTPSLSISGKKVEIDTPVNSILIDPQFPKDVYVATDVGVFVSGDRGASWQPHGALLPRTAVLELKMSSDRHVLAATHGRGVWAVAPLSH